jgi:hypothetical protein
MLYSIPYTVLIDLAGRRAREYPRSGYALNMASCSGQGGGHSFKLQTSNFSATSEKDKWDMWNCGVCGHAERAIWDSYSRTRQERGMAGLAWLGVLVLE